MQSFLELAQQFETKFNVRHFPKEPQTLYDVQPSFNYRK